jgi:peptide/nickel transport system substrate-binding protein
LALAGCLAAGAALAAACDAPGASLAHPVTLVVGVAQPRSAASDGTATRVASLLERASLLRLARDCRLEPALAASHEVAPDGLSWTLVLRDGLSFHDGTPIDAAAVAAVVNQVAGPAVSAASPPGLRDVTGATPAGDRVVRIGLRAPSALLGEALSALEIAGGRSGDSPAGPFRTSGEHDGNVELAAFPAFYRGTPNIDRIVVKPYATPRTAWAALLRGEVDFLHQVPSDAWPFLESSSDVQLRSFLRPYVQTLGFNVRHEVLRHPSVRHALSMSIDRAALIERALDGRGRPAFDPIWPLHWAADPAVGPVPVDIAAAVAQLDAAGLPLKATARPATGPAVRFSFVCLVPAGFPLLERLALAVQRDLAHIGVRMDLEVLPLGDVGRRLVTGAFDAYLLEMNGLGLTWTYWLWHSEASRSHVDAAYSGADAALDRVRHARTDEDIRAAVRDLQRRFRDDPPALFLCWPEAARAVSRRFALPSEPDRDMMGSLSRWQPSPAGR